MGPGQVLPDHEYPIDNIGVDAVWLRKRCSFTSPGNLAVLHAIGDSMKPTFKNGDVLLVDRGVTVANVDAVFVMAKGEELFIKRLLRHPAGHHLMISDNAAMSPIEIRFEGDLRIIGRVIYAWNGTEL